MNSKQENLTDQVLEKLKTKGPVLDEEAITHSLEEMVHRVIEASMIFTNNYEKGIRKVETLTAFNPGNEWAMNDDIEQLNGDLKSLLITLLKPINLLGHNNESLRVYLRQFLESHNLYGSFGSTDALTMYCNFVNYSFINEESIRVAKASVYSFNTYSENMGVIKFSNDILYLSKSILFDCLAYLKNLTKNINQSTFGTDLIGYYFMTVCEILTLHDYNPAKTYKLITND